MAAHTAPHHGMSVSSAEAGFIKEMDPYAHEAARATGMPTSFFLTQWALESHWGTSEAFRENHNAAGIMPWADARAGHDPTYAGYASLSDFEQGVVDFYEGNARYRRLLSAAHDGASTHQLLLILGDTGYATAPNYGQALETVLHTVQTITSTGNRRPASAREAPRGVGHAVEAGLRLIHTEFRDHIHRVHTRNQEIARKFPYRP